MFELSFNTVLMALLTSNLLFSLTCLIFRKSSYLISIGYKTVALILFLSVLRLMVPVDFKFTTNIHLCKVLSDICIFIRHPYTICSGIEFSIWYLLLIIWIGGILLNAISLVRQYHKIQTLIFSIGNDVSAQENYSSVLHSVCSSYGIQQSFCLFEVPFLSSPMLFSIRKPIILLPANNNYSEEELAFIFRHEITHFWHHDLIYKLLLQIVFIIYWWNPLKHLLKKQLNNLLEANVDFQLIQNKEDLIPYMECLLKIKKDEVTAYQTMFSNCTLSMNDVKESVLEKRFQLMEHSSKRSLTHSIFVVAIGLTIFLVSYCFTFEPYTLPQSNEDEQYIFLTDENAYAVLNEDGTYDLYLDDEYIETVTSLEEYDNSIPIYTKEAVK